MKSTIINNNLRQIFPVLKLDVDEVISIKVPDVSSAQIQRLQGVFLTQNIEVTISIRDWVFTTTKD